MSSESNTGREAFVFETAFFVGIRFLSGFDGIAQRIRSGGGFFGFFRQTARPVFEFADFILRRAVKLARFLL